MQPQPQRYMPPQPGYGQPQGFPQPPGGMRPPGGAPVPPAGFRPPAPGGLPGGPPGGLPGGPPGGLPGGPPGPGGLTAGVASMNLGSPLMSPSVGGVAAGFKSPQMPPGPPGGPRTPLAGPPRPPGPPGPLHATQNGLHGSPMPPSGTPGYQTNGGSSPAMPSMQQRYPSASLPGGPPSPMPAGSPRPLGPPLRPPGPPGASPQQLPRGMAPPMPGQAMPPQSPMMPAASMPGMPPSSMPGMRPPMQGMPHSPMPGMPQSPMPGMAQSPMPGMLPSSMQGMPHAPMPGMPHAPMQGMPHAPMPGMPHAPMPGMPHAPMPGMPPPPGPGAAPYPGGGPPMPGGGPPMPGGGPPMPGAYPAGPGMGHPQPGMGHPQPGMPVGQMAGPRKLDPDQMPSPIQVMADDQANRSGQFVTSIKGQVPPLTTTQFTVLDQGNVSPRLMRSSVYNVPVSPDMLKQTGIPLALSIAPLAELPDGEQAPPVVDLGAMGPVRCIRCKAYMCPFMTFIDGGRRFSCPFCKASTEVPQEYFQHLDHTGQRLDKYERPELCMGAYEFVCTKEYCRNNEFPKPPAYIFVIDVSYNNVKSGLVHLLCNNMKEVLRQLPVDVGQTASNMKVGFITYSNVVHFFNCKPVLAQPQMLVVGDVQDMFVPLVDGLLVDAAEAEAVIDSLMEQLPQMFSATRETEVVLGPAIQAGMEALKAGMEALKAANCSGRLLVFNSSLPTGVAPGQLKNRDDRKVLGSDKEKHVLTPQTQFYNNLGQECVQAGCSVNLFLLNNSYVDLPTVGQVVRLTGGEIYKYTYFQADLDGDRLLRDLSRAVWQPIGFDAIMRVRTSTGVRPVDFHGHFYMSNTTDMELAAIDSSQAVTVELKHDDKLTEEDGVYVQAALLYTACSGQRRLRVLNLSLNVCSQMADLYRSCELDTMTNLMVKQAVSKVLDANPRAIRDSLTSQCAQILASYRKNCASPSSAGQLILPECMKLLPLYANCILRSDAVSGGPELTIDERSFHMFLSTSLPVSRSVAYLYPRLLPLDQLDPAEPAELLPAPVRSSQDKLHDQGLFLLENGVHLFLWIGLQLGAEMVQDLFGVQSVAQVSRGGGGVHLFLWIGLQLGGEMVQDLFGVQSVAQIDVDRPSLPNLDTPLSIRVRGVIEEVRRQRQSHMKLTVVRQRDKLEMVFRHFLVEDKGPDGSASYVDYLCHLHKEIRALLT